MSSSSSDIEVGGIYETKVGTRTVAVRIERAHPKGGFDASSVASGKPIRIRDGARLRPPKAAHADDVVGAVDCGVAGDRAETIRRSGAAAAKKGRAKAAASAGRAAAKPPRASRAAKVAIGGVDAAPAKMTCLGAAVAVLRGSGEPMRCKAMVAAMAEQGLWTTAAPTPAATLSSAILRELGKGERSRFTKTGRGLFTLNHA